MPTYIEDLDKSQPRQKIGVGGARALSLAPLPITDPTSAYPVRSSGLVGHHRSLQKRPENTIVGAATGCVQTSFSSHLGLEFLVRARPG